MKKLIPLLLAITVLASCSNDGRFYRGSTIPVLAIGSAIDLGITGKTPIDHIVGWVKGKNCSVVRAEQGKSYCVEDQINYAQPTSYCYRNLGGISCYNTPIAGRETLTDNVTVLDERKIKQLEIREKYRKQALQKEEKHDEEPDKLKQNYGIE